MSGSATVLTVKLPLCRWVLGQTPLYPVESDAAPEMAGPGPRPLAEVCPACHVGWMQMWEMWLPQHSAPDIMRPLFVCDTS
jgi:hypothetical protein